MKRTVFSLFLAFTSVLAYSQLNMTLLDQIDYPVNANDIWAWVDPDDGTEYALVGLVNGLSIVDLTDPEDVVEVQFIPGPNSTWRDIKTWGNHAYVTNETSNGLLVVDMSGAPDNITWFEWTPDLPGLGTLSRCHNLYIDEFGYCYLSGCNLNAGGMLIIDVFSDPGNPQFTSAAPAVYSHDVYTRDHIMYASQIYAGNLGIYDVSNKQDIKLLATQQTPDNFTHNAWLNDAGNVVFTTDERPNAPVAAYDISNLDDIVELDQFRPVATLGSGVIPHNVHVWNDWLIISYYTDGGIIADASRPDNIIEVGNWDTFLGGNGGFSGVWGAYPYLPSGLVLLTDIGTGLYVCGATYVRACWLEGKVTNASTGAPVFQAEVVISSSQANYTTTDLFGEYKTGQALSGTFDVTFTATGFNPKTVQAILENGELTILNVALEPLTSFSVSGQAIKAINGTPVPGAQIVLQNGQDEYYAIADANGQFTFTDVFNGTYNLYAGAWGYLHEVVNNILIDAGTPGLVIVLDRGYQDDFVLDLGWTTEQTASTGWWEWGEPIGTELNGALSNPDEDVENDLGDKCYVTGNGGGSSGDDDVDNGVVTLRSPAMDLSSYNEPILRYRTWFVNGGGFGNPNDALEIRVSNGMEEVVLETITESNPFWRPVSEFSLKDLIPLTNEMHVIFETSDLSGSGHIVEAAVDVFSIDDISPYPLFTAGDPEGCAPFTVNFSDASDSTAVWIWNFEGGNPATSNEQNPVVQYNVPGTYTVSLTVVTNSGTVYNLDRPNFIVVKSLPESSFLFDVTGNIAQFTNLSSGGGNYQWDFGDGTTSGEFNPSHTYQETGLFEVTLSATNECGSAELTQTVEVLAIPPVAGFSPDVTEGCAPLAIQFTDVSTGNPNQWEWSFPGGTPENSAEQNPLITYEEPGTYSVTLKASNAAGTSEVIQSQFIVVESGPTAIFTYTATGMEITFANGSTDADTYEWTFGDGSGTVSTAENPVYTFTDPGEYEVTLTATNECGFSVFSQIVVIETNATNELSGDSYQLTALPNPFIEEVSIRYELQGPYQNGYLAVFDVLGRQIGSLPIQGSAGSISMGEVFPDNGLYMLRLVVDGKQGAPLRLLKIE